MFRLLRRSMSISISTHYMSVVCRVKSLYRRGVDNLMDDFNNNVFGVGIDFNNGGSFSSPFSAPASHDAEASDTSTQPEVDANEAEVAEAPVVEAEANSEETTTRKKPGRKAGRTSGRGPRKTDSAAVPWQGVRKILDAREKLDIVD